MQSSDWYDFLLLYQVWLRECFESIYNQNISQRNCDVYTKILFSLESFCNMVHTRSCNVRSEVIVMKVKLILSGETCQAKVIGTTM